jgi:hypothetical protein
MACLDAHLYEIEYISRGQDSVSGIVQWLQKKKKKTGNEKFPDVNLVLSICHLTVLKNNFYKYLNFEHNSNLSCFDGKTRGKVYYKCTNLEAARY